MSTARVQVHETHTGLGEAAAAEAPRSTGRVPIRIRIEGTSRVCR